MKMLISHHKRSSSSLLHVKRGIEPSNKTTILITMAVFLTVVVILILLILVIIILNQRRMNRNKISGLKPLQLVVTKEVNHPKHHHSKRESPLQMNGSLSVPVASVKPSKEHNSEPRPLILLSSDLKV